MIQSMEVIMIAKKSTELHRIMIFWQAIEELEIDANVRSLLTKIPDLEDTLGIIAAEKPENFDLEVTIVDEAGGDILLIPGSHKTFIKIKVNYNKLSLKTIKRIVLYDDKVSEWIISASSFSINNNKLSKYFARDVVDDSWNLLKQRVGYQTTSLARTEEIKSTLDNEHVVWCYNSSCTGKTWLAIQLLDKYSSKHRFAYNASSSQLLDINLLCFILEFGSDYGLLIDDLQGDPDLAYDIIKFICNHKNSLKDRNAFVVLVSWKGLREEQRFRDLVKRNNIVSFKTDPDKYLFFLKYKVEKISKNLLAVCRDNLCLLSKANILYQKKRSEKAEAPYDNSAYSISDYEKLLFEEFVKASDETQLKLAYICAVLGSFEYETPYSFLEQYGILSPTTIDSAKYAEGTIYVGHKDICCFIASYIEHHYTLDIAKKEIIMNYIKSLDGTLKWKALLHIGQNRKSEVYYFGFIWNLLNDLMDALRKAALVDPTFAKTPSSMSFILLVANYFHEVDDFRAVADSFANCFQIVDEHVVIDFNNCRTTKDFDSIKQLMIKEDSVNDPIALGYVSGVELNEEEMHTNWLLSLLVQASSIMRYFGYVDLVKYAERDLIVRQSEDGSWYPNRVPWVTACALRGLSKAEDYSKGNIEKKYSKSDAFIDKAISYLISNMNSSGYWDAHTGGWNKVYETSAMCLDALHKFGFDCADDLKTRKALEFLQKESSSWMDPGREIDGASTACCLMDALGVEETLLKYIQQLTERNITGLFALPTEEELRDESCKAALIAYYVTELCWNIIERDIDQLMDEFLSEEVQHYQMNYDSKEVMVVQIGKVEVKGNAQFIDGTGTQINYETNNSHSIEKEFEVFLTTNEMTEDEKKAVLSVLKEIDEAAVENPEKLKNEGSTNWLGKIKDALACVSSVAAISKASWWGPLKTMVDNFFITLH